MPDYFYGATREQIDATGGKLDRLVSLLTDLLRQSPDVRALQSVGAERAVLFFRRSTADGTEITDAQPFLLRTIVGALRAETYSLLLVALDRTSGAGRWLCHGETPTAAGYGVPVEGGESFTVCGRGNIDDFQIIAETGATVDAIFYLFK